jgi:hypothetical protein
MTNITTKISWLNTHVSIAPCAPTLIRRFVETADERCPLAGIWMPIQASDACTDDPELFWPAMRRLLSWRAIHPALTNLIYRGL